MLIREFVQNPAFDVNCYIKIFDSTKEAGWEGKIPVYDGYGSPVDTSEDILSMELSYVTTNRTRSFWKESTGTVLPRKKNRKN